MKRKIMIYLVAVIMVATQVLPVSVNADTGIDKTAPLITSIELINANNVDASEGVTFKIGVVEDGVGVDEINFFLDCDRSSGFWAGPNNNGEGTGGRIFSSNSPYTSKLSLLDKVPVGEFEIEAILISDANGNKTWYYKSDSGYAGENIDDISWVNGKKITVTKSRYIDYASYDPMSFVNGVELLDTEDIDASDCIRARIDVKQKLSSNMYLTFKSLDSDTRKTLHFDNKAYIEAGVKTIMVPINNLIGIGKYELEAFTFGVQFDDNNVITYQDYTISTANNPEFFKNTSINVTKSTYGELPIELVDLDVLTPEITTPGILEMDFAVKENGNPFKSVCMILSTDTGSTIDIWGNVYKQDNGKYRVNIPISAFFPEGELYLDTIFFRLENISEAVTNHSTVDGNRGTISGTDPPDIRYRNSIGGNKLKDAIGDKGIITIKSGYDISFYSSLDNPTALSQVQSLNDGEVAVLDCRSYKKAPKNLFLAIAGTNKTLAFVDENVQWVFNGKDIESAKCKDIDLTSNISVVSGLSEGFADDSKIATLEFANNGELPGEVEMRINYEYLGQKYKFDKNNLMITYMKPDGGVQVEDEDVSTAEDDYYEYTTEHNSKFTLSKNKARIGKTTVKFATQGSSKLSLNWNKTAGNGYYIYRSTSKSGTYKRIATLKSRNYTSYTDNGAIIGKTYYYKVKPYSNNSTLNKTAVTSAYCSAYKCLAAPSSVKSRNITKKSLKLTWRKVSKAKRYYVYRSTSKSGTYKKIASTRKTSYTNKKLKSKTSYYYKIVAVYKTAKYNSKPSAIKKVTTK